MKITRTIKDHDLKPILKVIHPFDVTGIRGVASYPQEATFDTDDPLVVISNGVDEVLTITVGGQVVPGPGIHMDDAARAFIEAISRLTNYCPFGLPSHR
jgi:hypothetical protein